MTTYRYMALALCGICTVAFSQFEPLNLPTNIKMPGSTSENQIANYKQFVFIENSAKNIYTCYALAKIKKNKSNWLITIPVNIGGAQWNYIKIPESLIELIAIANLDDQLALLAKEKYTNIWFQSDERYSIYILKNNILERLYALPKNIDLVPRSFSGTTKKIWINIHNTKTNQKESFYVDLGTTEQKLTSTKSLYTMIAHNKSNAWSIGINAAKNIELKIIDLDDPEIIVPIDEPQFELTQINSLLKELAPFDDEKAYYISYDNFLYYIELVSKNHETDELYVERTEIDIKILPKNDNPVSTIGFLDDILIAAIGNKLYQYTKPLEITIKTKEHKKFEPQKPTEFPIDVDFAPLVSKEDKIIDKPLLSDDVQGESLTISIAPELIKKQNTIQEKNKAASLQRNIQSINRKDTQNKSQLQTWIMNYSKNPVMQKNLQNILGTSIYTYFFTPTTKVPKPIQFQGAPLEIKSGTYYQRLTNWLKGLSWSRK